MPIDGRIKQGGASPAKFTPPKKTLVCSGNNRPYEKQEIAMRNDSMKRFMLALLVASALSVASNIACAQLTDDQATALVKKAQTGDAQASTTLRQAAEQGDTKAQFVLGGNVR